MNISRRFQLCKRPDAVNTLLIGKLQEFRPSSRSQNAVFPDTLGCIHPGKADNQLTRQTISLDKQKQPPYTFAAKKEVFINLSIIIV
jgi:hypothetical protein